MWLSALAGGRARSRQSWILATPVPLPSAVVSDLDLPLRGEGERPLGDGSESEFDIHEATVVWAGSRRLVAIDVAEIDPPLGVGLLLGNELTVQVIAGGAVALQRLRLA